MQIPHSHCCSLPNVQISSGALEEDENSLLLLVTSRRLRCEKGLVRGTLAEDTQGGGERERVVGGRTKEKGLLSTEWSCSKAAPTLGRYAEKLGDNAASHPSCQTRHSKPNIPTLTRNPPSPRLVVRLLQIPNPPSCIKQGTRPPALIQYPPQLH